MLAAGRALVGNPSLLLMDEPTEGLAPMMVRELGRTIDQRFGGLSDSVEMGFPASTPAAEVKEILADVHRVPVRFRAQPGTWD